MILLFLLIKSYNNLGTLIGMTLVLIGVTICIRSKQ